MQPTTAVIYLWAQDQKIADATFDEQAAACEAYAFRFCWHVVETIRDVGGSNEAFNPKASVQAFARTGLDQVFALLRERQAVIVLVPSRQVVGASNQVVNAVCERVEKHGFVQVVGEQP